MSTIRKGCYEAKVIMNYVIAFKVPAIETLDLEKWVDKYENWLIIYASRHTSDGKIYSDGFKVCLVQV